MTKYQKIWWFLWVIFFIFGLFHYICMSFLAKDIQTVTIEHGFYLLILAMGAVSVAPIKFCKKLLWFILFCGLATIYHLPDFQKITEIEACAEGKCQALTNFKISTTE